MGQVSSIVESQYHWKCALVKTVVFMFCNPTCFSVFIWSVRIRLQCSVMDLDLVRVSFFDYSFNIQICISIHFKQAILGTLNDNGSDYHYLHFPVALCRASIFLECLLCDQCWRIATSNLQSNVKVYTTLRNIKCRTKVWDNSTYETTNNGMS